MPSELVQLAASNNFTVSNKQHQSYKDHCIQLSHTQIIQTALQQHVSCSSYTWLRYMKRSLSAGYHYALISVTDDLSECQQSNKICACAIYIFMGRTFQAKPDFRLQMCFGKQRTPFRIQTFTWYIACILQVTDSFSVMCRYAYGGRDLERCDMRL